MPDFQPPDANATAPPSTQANPAAPAPDSLIQLQMSEDEVGLWWEEVEAARARVKAREVAWDVLMKEYMPTVTDSESAETVSTNAHFRNTHTKMASLFARVPELVLEAEEPLHDPVSVDVFGRPVTAEDAVVIKKAVLNKKLGRNGVNVTRLIDETCFDGLQWAGIGAVKIGYRSTVRNIQKPRMVPAPAPMTPGLTEPGFSPPGPVPGLGEGAGAPGAQGPPSQPGAPAPMVQAVDPLTGQPAFDTIPVPIYEDWFMKRISPKKVLFPSDLTSGRIDEDASWIGQEFYLTPAEAKSMLQYEAPRGGEKDDRVYKHPEDDAAGVNTKRSEKIRGVEIWLKAAQWPLKADADFVHHPLAIRQLILIEGKKDAPVLFRDSADQTFDENGQLTADSMVGFPIEVLHIRDIADSPYPPSDAAFTNSLIKQLNVFRRQSIQMRDASIGKFLYDEEVFTATEVGTIKNSAPGSYNPVKAGTLAGGADKVIAAMTQVSVGRDDARASVTIKQDMEETLGIGGPQSGVVEDQKRTATENTIADNKSQLRISKDQQRVVDFFLKAVTKYDALIQRYASSNEYIRIVGRDGLTRLTAWNQKLVSGRYAYDIKLDSQFSTDVARQKQQSLNDYTTLRPDPLVNPQVLLKKFAADRGYDPKELIVDPAIAQLMAATPGPEAVEGGPAPEGGGAKAPGAPAVKPTDTHQATKTGGLPNAPVPGRMPNTPGPVAR